MSVARLHAQDNVALRAFALDAGKACAIEAGNRIVDPVWLNVAGRQVVGDGFAEALMSSGFAPRMGTATVGYGTQVIVTEIADTSAASVVLSVRVERIPDRTIILSRVMKPGQVLSDTQGSGIVESLLVPIIAGVTAATLVFLLFTVRQ